MEHDVAKQSAAYPFLAGGGETGELIRSIDWAKTVLGAPDQWPQSLKTCVRIILTSRQPMFVWWGKELINIYNDAYIDIVRGKHPEALGQPATQVWREIWDQVGPRVDTAMQKNEGTYDEALLLLMERNGYREETYYTFSYSPVPGDDGGPAGIICANTDDTERIVGERHLSTLTDLGKALIDCKNSDDVFHKTVAVLQKNPWDFLFAFFYELDPATGQANLVDLAGAENPPEGIPLSFNIKTDENQFPSFLQAAESGHWQIDKEIGSRFANLPRGAWDIPPDQALVLPILQSGQKTPHGFLSVGINPYRLLNEKYLGFFQLIADQVATALANVHAYEQERQRAEALAEIDRAKTAFFSNISHEFRTPLTLMFSPLQEIRERQEELPEALRENVDVAYRNTLRLQKLVNSLLDFSRIEAGRMQAHYEAVDLATFTADLASAFRSAVEKAGMQLIVDCPPLPSPVFVDVDMWEKIILNLLSNAFKYTVQGKIEVVLRQEGNEVVLRVSDTGVGISEEELDKIFERFHRIQSIGRSQEGTGIGLALVQELVKLHHGKVAVKSKPGAGSTFTVTLPVGKDHLPAGQVVSTMQAVPARVDAYVEEALKWLPGEIPSNDINLPALQDGIKPKVLLADDNADMRDYLKRLLDPQYEVITAENGIIVLDKLRTLRPDLIISDVMMPGIDGFELVKRLKQNPEQAQIPILLLSARAGEEATVEGLQSGADDYLVKPFSAKELLSRIQSNIKIAQVRNNTAEQLRSLFMQTPVGISILRGPQFVIELANESMLKIWGKTKDIIGAPIIEALPEVAGTKYPELLSQVYHKGITHHANESSAYLIRNGLPELVYFNFVYQPLYELDGTISGIMVAANEVTDQVEARKKVEDAEGRLRLAAEGTGLGTWDLNLQTREIIYSPRLNQIFGHDRDMVMTHAQMRSQIHPDDIHVRVEKAFEEAMKTGTYAYEARLLWKDGTIRWIRTRGKVLYDDAGKPVRMLGTMFEITAEKQAELALRESEERYRQLAQQLEMRINQRTKDLSDANENLARSNKELEQFAFITSHDLQEPLRKIQTFGNMLHDNYSTNLSDRGQHYLEKMLSASQRMSKLINDLLNFSRLRQSEESFIAVDLNEILANVKNDFELVINRKQAVIEHTHLPAVEANPLQMNQLFYNLLSNALKFTQDGRTPHITISCRSLSTQERDRFAGLSKELDYYELVFADNGIGFAQEYAQKIFEIFQRLNARAEYEGTGIGLALVNKIMENHGGLVFAESKDHGGAAFHILLPVRQNI